MQSNNNKSVADVEMGNVSSVGYHLVSLPDSDNVSNNVKTIISEHAVVMFSKTTCPFCEGKITLFMIFIVIIKFF